jgi:hypothetical protein
MTKQKDQSSTAALPSNGVAPAAPSNEPDRECIHCGRGADDFFGPVTLDRFGWWMHASCRRVVEVETAPWRR